VFLEVPGGDEAVRSLEVYNALGARCAVQPVRTADGLLELNLGSFGTGMFIVNVVGDGRLMSTRVVVE